MPDPLVLASALPIESTAAVVLAASLLLAGLWLYYLLR